MALLNGTAHEALSANAGMMLDAKLTQELWELQQAVIDRKHPQLNLPDEVISRLKGSIVAAGLNVNSASDALRHKMSHNLDSARHNSGQYDAGEDKMQGLQENVVQASEVNIGVLHQIVPYKAEEAKAKRAIWLVIDGQIPAGEVRRAQLDGQYDSAPADLDAVLARANSLVKPVYVTKATPTPTPAPSLSAKSSFDENDYYSSLVQSDWSSDDAGAKAEKSQAFTADFVPLEAGEVNEKKMKRKADGLGDTTRSAKRALLQDEVEDDYEPAEPSPALNVNMSDTYVDSAANRTSPLLQAQIPSFNTQQISHEADSDYEPGQVSQDDDDEYDPQSAPEPSPRVVRNTLTQIAAPQPNRVSPLAIQKQPQAEYEMVNGRPEMTKKRKARVVEVTYERPTSYESPGPSHAALNRMSSASPPSPNPTLAKRQKKKEKRLKRNQQTEQQKSVGKRRNERQVSGRQKQNAQKGQHLSNEPSQHQPHHARLGSGFVPAGPRSNQDVNNAVAYQPQYIDNEQYISTRASSVVHHMPNQQFQTVYAPVEQQVYRQSTIDQAPQQPSQEAQVVVDQFGNRYYAAPEQPAAPASPPRHNQAQFGQAQLINQRAPSRVFTPAPAYQEYNPAEARMLPPQLPTRRDVGPLDVIEQINGKRYRVQEIQEEPQRVLEQNQYQNGSFGIQRRDEQRHFGLPPQTGMVYNQVSRVQPMAPPSTRAATQVPFERAYSVRPEASQPQMQDLYSPEDVPQFQRDTRGGQPAQVFQVPHSTRIGSVAPIQYIQATPRQGSVAPIQYVQRASNLGVQQIRPASVVPAQSEYDPLMPSSGMSRQISGQHLVQTHEYSNGLAGGNGQGAVYTLPQQYRQL